MLIKILVVIIVTAMMAQACGEKKQKSFCADPCLKDTVKFVNETNPLQPYVYISAKNCLPDTLTWSYKGMGVNRKLGFAELVKTEIQLDQNLITCHIQDTSYIWLLFNDCGSGRGFLLKIPFDKKKEITRKGGAINRVDPKYSVAEGLVAYTDKGNIFVEEMATGKKAMMTFGKATDIDYDAMHETLDSVNITPTRIWAKVKMDNDWKEFEKNITLELASKD